MARVMRFARERRSFPAGLHVGAGALAVVVATMMAAGLPATDGWWRTLPVAAAVLGFAMLPVRLWTVVFTAMLGYLFVDGFLVDRYGELSWHGRADAARLALFAGAAVIGLVAGAIGRRYHRSRPMTVPVAWTDTSVRKDVRSG